jgi:NitT/TauT family transport system substrate-binding protein
VIFCEVVRRDPFFLVGREPRPGWQLIDLLRVRVATVSEVPTPWLCLQHDLRLAGLDPAQVRRIPDRSMPENLAALRAGDIEVMQAFQPFVEQAVEAGAGHIWYAAASRGLTAYTSFYTTRQCLARDPESLLRMTRAMYRTQQWIATHSAAELAACVASFFPDLPRPTLTAALERYKTLGVWNRTPMLQPEGLAWLDAACRSGGYIQHSVPYEQCVDMRFAAQVIAETPPAFADDPDHETP